MAKDPEYIGLLAQRSTIDILQVYGNVSYKDGQTFRQAWDATEDKNVRYAIRKSLLILMGHIT